MQAGQSLGEVESTKSVSDIYAPLTGTVVEVNEALADHPERLNGDPYGEGWLCVIEVADAGGGGRAARRAGVPRADRGLSGGRRRDRRVLHQLRAPEPRGRELLRVLWVAARRRRAGTGRCACSRSTRSRTRPDRRTTWWSTSTRRRPAPARWWSGPGRPPASASAWTLPLTRLGRHPQSDVSLDDITVSRRHAEIERLADGGYEVRDAGSLNGTYVNGERVEKARLRNGDEVQIGKFRMVFLDALGGTA